MAVTSLLSDLGHETESTVLPTFMAALGLPPAALGVVEGVADATASFVKLGAGWYSDHIANRKVAVVLGYLATGLSSGILAMANGFAPILAGKAFGWFGRGVRSPLRNAMLTDAVPEQARGRAFGFHRFGDTVGAILGPAAAVGLLASAGSLLQTTRRVLWWSLVPGVLAAVVFAIFVAERGRKPSPQRSFPHALGQMPPAFRRYLLGVGLFGAGDYAHTMLILAATQLLTPSWGPMRAAEIGGSLYVLHNVVYAAAAWPAGAMADRLGHQRVLAWGYTLSVAVPLSVAAWFHWHVASVLPIAASFCGAGLVNGVQDTLENAATGAFVPKERRGLAFGLLGATNGVGDLVSSAIVGALWTAYPALGFGWAALLMALGAAVMRRSATPGFRRPRP